MKRLLKLFKNEPVNSKFMDKDKHKMIGQIFNIQAKIRKEIPNINKGGCGRFALRVHRALNHAGIKNEMRVELDMFRNKIRENKKNIRNVRNLSRWEKDDLSFSHAWIRIPHMDINFDGIDMTTEGESFPHCKHHGQYNDKEMSTVVAVGNWNPRYKTKFNERLSRIIYSEFK